MRSLLVLVLVLMVVLLVVLLVVLVVLVLVVWSWGEREGVERGTHTVGPK